MSDEREVFITGIGAFTPIGNSPEEILRSLREKRDGIGVATKIDTSKFTSNLAGEVSDFEASKLMSPAELDTFSEPFLRLAICAARSALGDAKQSIETPTDKIALVIATCNAGMTSREIEYRASFGDESAEFNRSVSFQSEFYAPAKALASVLKISAETWVVNTACSGSTAAIALAQDLIFSGKFDAVLVGGADALSLANYAGFSAIKVVSPEKIAPFSSPVGMNIGEGAAFWFLESAERAKSRGAKVYGAVIGSATGGDAHHPTQPDPRGDGAFRVMRAAIANAGVALEDIACINAHGSGTAANDKAESKGLKRFLGEANIPVTSTKSYTGHCMGATGIIEATCQLLSMNDNFIPPTLHNVGTRAGCEISAVSGDGIEREYDCFLSSNYAFAGNNAAVVIAKPSFKKFARKPVDAEMEVVITGAGIVNSLGLSLDENLDALSRGDSGVDVAKNFESSRRVGEVQLPPLRSIDRRIDFSGMNRISAFATIACARALEFAKFRVSRANSEEIGLVSAICRGACDTPHMRGVFLDPERRGDISCFSNVTANSTAGWVSKALEIKGSNVTLTSGLNCSAQSLEYAIARLRASDAKQILAFSADELSAAQLAGYEKIGYAKTGEAEQRNQLEYAFELATVYGEGAAAVLLESRASAEARGACVLGKISACASTMDVSDFSSINLSSDGIERAARLALARANLSADEIEMLIWSPRGCSTDAPVFNLRDSLFSSVPMATTTFHAGYAEASSALASIVCVLQALSSGRGIWKQKTGVKLFDEQVFPREPKKIMFLSSSFDGANYATIIER